MDCSTPGFTVHHQLLELTQTHVHRAGDAIQPSHSLTSPSIPAFKFPIIKVFSNKSVVCIRWWKYWSFSFSISPSNEHLGLISFRMDWLDLLAVQGTLKTLLKSQGTLKTSKASILQCSTFFIVQLSHPYMTTWKTVALNRWTFVGKVMLLLFNMLFRLVITFLPRSKHLLISWLQSSFAVILEPKIKSLTVPGSLRVRHDWATSLSLFTFMHWRRKWQPTPGFLPGESQGRGSLVGCGVYGVAQSQTRLKWLSRWDQKPWY